MTAWWETKPEAWRIRAAKAYEHVDMQTKATVTVRCGNQGCGGPFGHIYSSCRGPLWVPLKSKDGRRNVVNELGLALIDDPGLPEGWQPGLIGCAEHVLGSVTRQQLRDAWEARRRGRRVRVLLQHPKLYGNRPGEWGGAVGRELTGAELIEIRDEPSVSF